jgi:hypothetical protein
MALRCNLCIASLLQDSTSYITSYLYSIVVQPGNVIAFAQQSVISTIAERCLNLRFTDDHYTVETSHN